MRFQLNLDYVKYTFADFNDKKYSIDLTGKSYQLTTSPNDSDNRRILLQVFDIREAPIYLIPKDKITQSHSFQIISYEKKVGDGLEDVQLETLISYGRVFDKSSKEDLDLAGKYQIWLPKNVNGVKSFGYICYSRIVSSDDIGTKW